jgi:hypothetical protein
MHSSRRVHALGLRCIAFRRSCCMAAARLIFGCGAGSALASVTLSVDRR